MFPLGGNSPSRKPGRIRPIDPDKLSASENQERRAREREARKLHRQAAGLKLRGHMEAAFGCLLQAVQLLVNKPSETTLMIGSCADLADMLYEMKMWPDAEHYYSHVIRLGRMIPEPLVLAKYGGRYARMAAIRGDWVEAETRAWEALRALAQHDDPELTAFTNVILGEAMLAQGRRSEALAHATAALAIARRIKSPNLLLADKLLRKCQE